ncbi:MAG: hypothetical protein JO207_06450 [Verrucomicrobia bacterium]|nr:hypothetical protein [Verrucomicrobiota bacterium]
MGDAAHIHSPALAQGTNALDPGRLLSEVMIHLAHRRPTSSPLNCRARERRRLATRAVEQNHYRVRILFSPKPTYRARARRRARGRA